MAATFYSSTTTKSEFITTYSFATSGQSDETHPAVLALSDGGFAVGFVWALPSPSPNNYSVLLDIYNADGTPRLLNTVFPDTFVGQTAVSDPSLTQLSNGNILMTWSDADIDARGIHYAIIDPELGAVGVSDTLLPGTNVRSSDCQIVALDGGGWAVAIQDNLNASDVDADIRFYNAEGQSITSFALGNNSSSNERQPVLALLDSENIAVAYEKELSDGSGTYGIWFEILSQTGTVLQGPTQVDLQGTQNRNPAIVSLRNGGFAIAYEDNEYGQGGITIAFVGADGVVRGTRRADDSASTDHDPSLTMLANGFVAVSFTRDFSADDSDIQVSIFNPVFMTQVDGPQTFEGQFGFQANSSLATLNDGTLVTSWTDFNADIGDGNTDPNGAHVSIQFDRIIHTWFLDDAGESVTGDELDDSVVGGLGLDTIAGGGGNDTIDGGGGKDSMNGGSGDDSFYVNVKTDIVVEAIPDVFGGSDTVFSGASTFTLGTNVEDLTLTGAKNSTGIGNTLANRMTGNGGHNSLQGLNGNDTLTGGEGDDDLRGGAGGDRMNGGNGNDRFFVDNAGDLTIESNANIAAGGIDTVFTSINRVLSANIENLRLQGTGNINGNGNDLGNRIFGNAGANILKGLAGNDTIEGRDGADTIDGGEGNDTLSGGSQSDVFRFATANAGVDRILDFNKNADRFDLSGGSFSALTTAANGDAVLTHDGGAIRIAAPPSLTLAQWDALVSPGNGKAAPDAAEDAAPPHGSPDGDVPAPHNLGPAPFMHADWALA